MKTLTPKQRMEGFTELEGVLGEGGVGGAHLMSFLAGVAHAEKVLASQEQDDAPVATLDHNGNFELLRMVGVTVGQSIKLYEHPSSRKPFVRLNEDEITELAWAISQKLLGTLSQRVRAVRAIEDALEKANA